MNFSVILSWVTNVAGWVSRSSWQGAVLIFAVLLGQWLLRGKLSARWRFALWWLVLARLLVPFSPESALSMFNLVNSRPAIVAVEKVKQMRQEVRVGYEESPTEPAGIAAGEEMVEPQKQRWDVASTLRPAQTIAVARIHFSTWEIAGMVWLGVSFALALRVIQVSWGMRLRIRQALPVEDPAVLELFAQCTRQMNVRASVRLMETDLVKSPALCGFWRPLLLLPPGLAREFSPTELRYVFLHELAHVRRKDVALNWLLTLLQIAHWFNPVVWIGFARMRADREMACDALAIASASEEDAKAYGLTIIKLLETLSRPSAMSGLVGIMEDKSQMKRRIGMIAAFKKSRHWSLLALGLMAALGLTGLTSAIKQKEIVITVLDAQTGQPIPGAGIVEGYAENGVYSSPRPLRETDRGGKMVLSSRDSFAFAGKGFAVVDSNHAPKAVTWNWGYPSRSPEPQFPDLPAQYTIRLDAGSNIGGLVCDEQGRPVTGARVELRGLTRPQKEDPYELSPIEYSLYNTMFGRCPVTDAKGRWSCPHFPREIDMVEVCVVRPDNSCARFHTDPKTFASPGGELIQLEDLRRGTCKLVMKEGVTVRGIVTDQPGKPLAGIILEELDQRYHFKPLAKLVTGPDGRFELPNRDPHQIILKATGPGFAINPAVVDIRPGLGEVRIAMSPAKPLRLRVVDESGKPIRDAQVFLENPLVRWSVKTDRNGRAEWKDAPAEPQQFAVDAENYCETRKQLKPSDSEQTITLRKQNGQGFPVLVKARSSDNRPIESFEVTAINQDDQDAGHEQNWIGTGTNGVFDGSASMPKLGWHFRLRIDAPGLEPALTEPFELQKDDVIAEVTLNKRKPEPSTDRKAGSFNWRVLKPDGSPAAQAHVVAANGGTLMLLFFNHERPPLPQVQGSNLQTFRADDSGMVAFQPREGDSVILVMHESGFLKTTFSKMQGSPELRLQAWGKVEGTLTLNGQPKADRRLYVQPGNGDFTPSINYLDVKTGPTGHFSIFRLPPGEYCLACTAPSVGTWPMSHLIQVNVAAGQTTQVEYKVAGRSVHGRLKTVPPSFDLNWPKAVGTHLLKQVNTSPGAESPAYSDFVRQEDYEAANQAWAKSLSNQRGNSFQIELEPTGEFYAEGLPAGKYELKVDLINPQNMSKPLGSITKEVVVPPAKDSSEILDLGEFEIPIEQSLVPPKNNAHLVGTTADGAKFDIKDLRGKCVVATFWSGWAMPSQKEIDQLKAVADSFGSDPRFAMVSVALEEKAGAPTAAAPALGSKVINVRLAGSAKAAATDRFGVDTLPSSFVVGPGGEILTREVQPGQLRAVIEQVLKGTK